MKQQIVFKKTLKTFILGSVIISMLISCKGNKPEQFQQMAAPDVDFYEIQENTAHTEKKYPGNIEGTVNVDIKAQVTGYLDAIYVKEGDFVSKGQSLFRIKGDVYAQQVETGQASLKAALAAEESAKIEVEKLKPLVAAKVIAETQLQTAQANYAAAKAQVAQAKSSLGSSQINVGFTQIKAPVSGYIGRIPNRIGSLVTPADVVPLTTLSEINTVFVYFSLSEADFISYQKDIKTDAGLNTVQLILADGSIYNHQGKVEIASGNIDKTTGSIPLKAIFQNPDKLLRSGGSAKVILRKTLNNALTIPIASVKDIQNKFFVYVLGDSNKVSMKPIEIEGRTEDLYILKSGLNIGEKIAINRIDMLIDGIQVSPASTTKKEEGTH